jgi:hypothetical protein
MLGEGNFWNFFIRGADVRKIYLAQHLSVIERRMAV